MNMQIRIERLEQRAEGAKALRMGRVPVELLTDAQIDAMIEQSDYDVRLLTDAELNALRDCYTDDTGELIPERITPELEAALERVFNTPRA
jgi:hypothetical protein